MKENKQLTKAETQVMQALWSLPAEGALSAEIMERMPEPKPALTTLLTFLKILKDKGFVTSQKEGRGQRFRAEVSKADYTRMFMKEVKQTFFGGSFTSLVSFFAKEEKLTEDDISEILRIIEKKDS
jgi:predicted transcriptional regulator